MSDRRILARDMGAAEWISEPLIAAAGRLRDDMDRLAFAPPVTHVYNPLGYAWDAHRDYLSRFGNSRKKVVFLGMNPGPWGMAQIGVPFGEVAMVRDWMGIERPVGRPSPEHPKRPIEGFSCMRSEVSGRRLWGLFRDRFGEPEAFFKNHLVINYCPLVFMEATGRNRTPDKLTSAEQRQLMEACDLHLRRVLKVLEPEWAVGVGKYAEACLRRVGLPGIAITSILHPSPASPLANRDWAGSATAALVNAGVW
jgi:single-strand selective monofunctional uracil DNA glycosylase